MFNESVAPCQVELAFVWIGRVGRGTGVLREGEFHRPLSMA